MASWERAASHVRLLAELETSLQLALRIGTTLQGRVDAALEYLTTEPPSDATDTLVAILRGEQ